MCKMFDSEIILKSVIFIFFFSNYIPNILGLRHLEMKSPTRFPHYHEYTTGGGELPYVGGYRPSVIKPPFLRQSYNQRTPFFFSPHPMTPFLHTNSNFPALRAHLEKFKSFAASNIKFANFGLKLHFFHTE